MNPYYKFLKNMWIMRKVDEEYLKIRIEKKQITILEYETIIAEPQVSIR